MSSRSCKEAFWRLAEDVIVSGQLTQDQVSQIWDGRFRGQSWCIYLGRLQKKVKLAIERQRLDALATRRDPLYGGL